MSENTAGFCAQCNNPFRCGRDDEGGCWCARDFPALPEIPAPHMQGCLCPGCLTQVAARYLNQDSGAG